MRERLRALGVMIATPFRAAPGFATATVVLSAIGYAFTPVFAYAMKLVVDGVVDGDMRMAAIGVLIMGGGEGLAYAAGTIGIATFRMGMEERTRLYIERRVIHLVTSVPGLEHHERPEYLNELDRLRAERGQLAQPAGPVVFLFATSVTAVGSLGLLATVHPLLLVLPLFGIPSVMASMRGERWRIEAWERIAEPERLRTHLRELVTLPRFAKEVRLFGLESELIGRESHIGEVNASEVARAGARGAALTGAGWLFFAIGYVAAVVFVVLQAVAGRATIGDVMLALTLAAQVNAMIASAASNGPWLRSVMRVVRRYLWLEDYARKAWRPHPDPTGVPDTIRSGIAIDGVSFRYPGTDADVLQDVSLDLPAGSTVAIVGENGAGKTTLIKLLSRFYDPTTGRISVDGVDLRRFDHEQWRSRMSAGFQDFAKLELLARENVGVGELTSMDVPGAVEDALERAHAMGVMTSLPDGLETQLGKSFDGGVDLSGGEWQKLALGRAMMRESPLLLVLDEPTASLDAETEHALFERYASAARGIAGSSGGITVLVSHRFSTVRMADLIVVVDGGRVVEHGSHGELMQRDGLYAELYAIQARGYR